MISSAPTESPVMALSQAFRRQALSDWRTYQILVRQAADLCQQLHYLQMACEKLCKAHQLAAGSKPQDVQSGHRSASKVLPAIIKQILSRQALGKISASEEQGINKRAKKFAREVELLAPAVDDGGRRPDNCEYPWKYDSGDVFSPLDYNFPGMRVLTLPSGGRILKAIEVPLVAAS